MDETDTPQLPFLSIVGVDALKTFFGDLLLFCEVATVLSRADILRETRRIACFFASERTVEQGIFENGPFPALPQHLGRFCVLAFSNTGVRVFADAGYEADGA